MNHFKKAWAIALSLLLIGGVVLAESTRNHVPDGSVVFVTVSDLSGDAGMSWLRNAWQSSPRESGLRSVFESVSYGEASVAVLGSDASGSPRILLVVSLESSSPTSVLDTILQADSSQIQQTSVAGTAVRYVETLQPGQDFGAYAQNGTTLLLGGDRSILEDALTAGAMTGNPGVASMGGSLDLGSNGLLFADNDDLLFADFLMPLERKWGMSLLLSADQLEWMGSAFDVESSDRIVGTILFKGTPDALVADIRDDAEFLGEAFRRKFMAEQIDYTSDVAVDGSLVELAFEITGLEPLWLRLFEQGVLSIIQPQ